MKHTLKIAVSLVLLVAVSVLSGCGTMQAYPGEARSPDQVAIIKPGHRFGPNAEIISIDGRKLGSGEDRVEVLPGRHTISARVIVSNGEDMTVITNPMELHLDAQAGHTYLLFGEASGGGWFSPPTEFGIWIQDKDSNTLVTRVGLDPQ